MKLRDNRQHNGARKYMHHSLTAVLATVLIVAISGCSPTPDTSDSSSASNTQSASIGSAAIFTPSDGITLTQHTPLNKWTVFVSELSSSLQQAHMQKKAITSHSYDTLDEQSQAIQDYVVSHVSQSGSSAASSSSSSSNTNAETLIVAPVIDTASFQHQFGDYFGSALQQTASSSTATPSTATSDTASPSTSSSTSSSSVEQQAIVRLQSALNLAKKSGMHVVLLSSTLEDFTPDLYVPMSSVKQMAQVQAKQLVNKLELDKTSKENPKQIEIMLPTDSSASSTSADEFDKTAFAAIWEVLGPYFRSGAVKSPSGLLDSKSTADSWQLVSFNASNEDSIKKELTIRLGKQSKSASSRTRVDGILAMNDYVASEITTTLTSLGYTGTSADINPEISIAGIVDNITGKADLKKDKVPDPSVAPTSSEDSSDSSKDASSNNSSESTGSSADSSSSAWPIVTGYGAYLDNIPSIVNGQQWMTALEDRKAISNSLAKAVRLLNLKQSLSSIDGISNEKNNGISSPTLQHQLLTVSASNLKTALIDTDYVTAADAGL
ncbi:MAG: xylose ABC transporter [Bifidobacterium sp.]|nr:xylose ABC transporter [Bifidobacterium sp.]MCH4174281.1 xylose ABC transporter [Bifidobacterium sp.]